MNPVKFYVCENYYPEFQEANDMLQIGDLQVLPFPCFCDNLVKPDSVSLWKADSSDHQILYCPSNCKAVRIFPDENHENTIVYSEFCMEHLIDCQTHAEMVSQKAFILSTGWLKRWESKIKQQGFDQSSARQFYGEWCQNLIYIDPGVWLYAADELSGLSSFLNIDFQIVKSDLKRTLLILENSYVKCKIRYQELDYKSQKSAMQQRISESETLRLLIHEIVSTTDKNVLIENINRTWTMLFGVEKVLINEVTGLETEVSGSVSWDGQYYHYNPASNTMDFNIVFDDTLLARCQAVHFLFPENILLYDSLINNLIEISAIALSNITKIERLAQSREDLRITLQSIGDAVISTDSNGHIQLMNPIAEKLTGYSIEEAIGQKIEDILALIHEDSREPAENPIRRVLISKSIEWMERDVLLVKRDGSRIPIEDSAAPVFDNENVLRGTVLVFRDVTEEKRLQDKLLQIQRLEGLGTIAGGIAHDFNNVLTGIYGYLTLAIGNMDSDSKSYNYLLKSQKSLESATLLTSKLLTFSRGGDPVRQSVSLVELIEDIGDFTISGSNIKIHYDFQDSFTNVMVDRDQIQQAISNLIINARQAMPEGGNIYIGLGREYLSGVKIQKTEHLVISVRDDGPGIVDSELSKIFDPYYTSKKNGNGLGLAITQSIINKHKGFLEVESEIGKGTLFRIIFPAVISSDTPLKEKKKSSVSDGAGKRILVLDDEEVLCSYFRDILENYGYKVQFYQDGIDALSDYEAALDTDDEYDLVITDLTIPGGIGGVEVTRKIREWNSKVKVIATSGYSNDPVFANCMEYGFNAVLSKPFVPDELMALIHENI